MLERDEGADRLRTINAPVAETAPRPDVMLVTENQKRFKKIPVRKLSSLSRERLAELTEATFGTEFPALHNELIRPGLLFTPHQPFQNKPRSHQHRYQKNDLSDIQPGIAVLRFLRIFRLTVRHDESPSKRNRDCREIDAKLTCWDTLEKVFGALAEHAAQASLLPLDTHCSFVMPMSFFLHRASSRKNRQDFYSRLPPIPLGRNFA
jgi:hypothetical protein